MKLQWEMLYHELKNSIRSRQYAPGERLPTEHELSAKNGVSRNTVRRAYLALSQDGLIRIINGRGSYVMPNGLIYEIDARSRFRDILEKHGVKSSFKLIDCGVKAATTEQANRLKIQEGSNILHHTALILGDDIPFILTTRYFPLDLMGDFENRLIQSGSFTALLQEEALGDLQRIWTSVGARMPQDEETSLLSCPHNAPLLDVSALGQLSNGKPVEWQHAVMNSHLIRLAFPS